MNIQQLYASIPPTRHADIIIDGSRVLVKDAAGAVAEYLLRQDGELFALPTTATKAELQELKTNLSAVDNKLAAAIEVIRKDVAAIKAKVGAGPVA